MSTGNYSIVIRRAGEVLTALEYNSDHQNHITNNTPDGNAGYSETTQQMQIKTDPYPGAVESLAPSLAGEVERLRFDIAQVKGYLNGGVVPAFWYTLIDLPRTPATKAIVSSSVDLVIPSSAVVFTQMTLNTATFNDASIWSGGSPTRFTAPTTGKYYFGSNIRWTNSANPSQRILAARLNGTTIVAETKYVAVALANVEQNVSCEYLLTAGDYIEFQVLQDTGGAINISSTGVRPYSTVCFFLKVGS